MPSRLDHPALGTVLGKANDGVVQYLGVKYASLENWLAPSKLIEYRQGESIDATSLGPCPISPPSGCAMEMGFIQQKLPFNDASMSGTACLNLNITVPEPATHAPAEKLPVFVYLHGGGFGIGANSWPQYDQARLVRRAAECGNPVIGVGINYRLGAPGFLTSAELRDAGYLSNNGLRDQAMALKWVKKYIAGFGGDSNNVTCIGESAGAASGHFHLQSSVPLFERYASLGGTALLIPKLPPPVTEHGYAAVCQALGLEELSGQDRVQALIKTSSDDLLTKLGPNIPLMPALDDQVVPKPLSFADLAVPGSSWCKEILIGDCQLDAMIFERMIASRKSGIGKAFVETARRVLESSGNDNTAIQSILDAYHLGEDSTASTSDDEAFFRILEFAQDVGFLAPTVVLARQWANAGNKAYVYRFNEPNPWDGPWKGHATHILDAALLFLNYDEALSPDQRKVAHAFADNFIAFVNGNEPWRPVGADGKTEGVMAYGPSDARSSGKYVEGLVGGETGRRSTLFTSKNKVALDDLSAVWGTFLQGA